VSERTKRLELHQVLQALPNVIEAGAFGAARLNLELGVRVAQRRADFESLLKAIRRVPMTVVLEAEDDAWAVLFARLLSATSRCDELLVFSAAALERFPNSSVLAHRAWALLQQRQYEPALVLIERCVHFGLEIGLARRLRAQVLAALGRDGWREAFAQARRSLEGRALGLCLLEEGVWLAHDGDEQAALHCFSAALPRFDDDAHYRAWLTYNLGLLCLRSLLPETESYFLELQRLSTHPDAKPFEARALCGLGAYRRALGEWDRAESAYRRATTLAATDQDDLQQAWRGLGLTLRMRGLPRHAFDPLLRALQAQPAKPWVHVELAALHAQLGAYAEVNACLERAGTLSGEDFDRAQIVRAALKHRDGDHTGALEVLRELGPNRLWVREESSCFPELFALLGPDAPAPLPRSSTTVEVHACGVLRVTVNGRTVPLGPTGRAGQLLVLLLEQPDHAQSSAYLLERIYGRDSRGKAQALSAVARELRQALGWKESINAPRKAYRLDAAVIWRYDAQQKRARNEPIERFLEGVDAGWTDDVRRHGQILD
jgi:tetratricopeptide (TPR) repeat protein